MDNPDRHRRARLFTLLQKGVRAVSARAQGTLTTPFFRSWRSRRIRLGAAMVLSIGLGCFAFERSKELALSDWTRSHPPSAAAWRHSLVSRGYTRLQRPGELSKALRGLPIQLDSGGSAWVSRDANWIAVILHPDEAVPAEVFCADCSRSLYGQGQGWEPAGTGWLAFDVALARADRALERLRSNPKPRRALFPDDPRELRY
jgi:hypothetical protein